MSSRVGNFDDTADGQIKRLIRSKPLPNYADPQQCWCETCRPITMTDMRFIVCPTCGNKRCPRATDHIHACTNSNEPGQAGSSWENYSLDRKEGQS